MDYNYYSVVSNMATMKELKKKKEEVKYGRYAKGHSATPRSCDMCHEMYVPGGWESRETSMPETFPRIAFDSARCRERTFEICGDCVQKVIAFIEENHRDYDKLKKLREQFKE